MTKKRRAALQHLVDNGCIMFNNSTGQAMGSMRFCDEYCPLYMTKCNAERIERKAEWMTVESGGMREMVLRSLNDDVTCDAMELKLKLYKLDAWKEL